MTHNKPSSRTQGFTILEVLIATILIGALISSGIYFVNLAGKRSQVENTAIELSLLRNFPSAILQAYISRNTLVGVSKQDLIDTEEVSATQPSNWEIGSADDNIGPSRNSITIVVTLPDSDQATAVRDFIQNSAQSNHIIQSVVLSGSNMNSLQVTYQI